MGIRLLLLDSEVLFRQGIKALLQTEPAIEIIGEAAAARDAIERATALDPDLVMMEIRLPDGEGIAAIRTIRRHCPRTQVLVLTSSADQEDFRKAAEAGAIGYIIKDIDSANLVEAIRSAHAGKRTLSPTVLENLIEHHFSAFRGAWAHRADRVSGRQPHLKQHEVDVLTDVAQGLSDKIGAKWFLSVSAVKTRLRAIYHKRGLPFDARRALKLAVYTLAFGAGFVVGISMLRHGSPPAPRAVTRPVTAPIPERIRTRPFISPLAINATPPLVSLPPTIPSKKAGTTAPSSPVVSRKPPRVTTGVLPSAPNTSEDWTNRVANFRRYGERAIRQDPLEIAAAGLVQVATPGQPAARGWPSPSAQSAPTAPPTQPPVPVAPPAQPARLARPAPVAPIHAPPGAPVWIVFGQSVGAAKLGVTLADLTGLFGKPTDTVRLADGSVTQWWLDASKQEGFGARIAGNGRVDRLSLVNDARYMTDAGLNVGRTETEVRMALGAPRKVDIDANSHKEILRYDQLGVWFEIQLDPKSAGYATVVQIDVVARATRAPAASPQHVRESGSEIGN